MGVTRYQPLADRPEVAASQICDSCPVTARCDADQERLRIFQDSPKEFPRRPQLGFLSEVTMTPAEIQNASASLPAAIAAIDVGRRPKRQTNLIDDERQWRRAPPADRISRIGAAHRRDTMAVSRSPNTRGLCRDASGQARRRYRAAE